MEQFIKISVRLGAVIAGVVIAISSNIPVYAQTTGDAVVTFTFTPKETGGGQEPGDTGDPESDPEGPGKEPEIQEPVIVPTVPVKPNDPEESDDDDNESSDEDADYHFWSIVEKKSEPKEENIISVNKTVSPDNASKGKQENETIQKKENVDKNPSKLVDVLPYVVTVAAVGVVAATAGASGALSGLWILIAGAIFKKKKKHWSGLLTYTPNLFVKVRGRNDDTQDMQDILDEDVTIDELRSLMKSSGAETILPVNTKMNIDIEGVEKEFDADEDTFYRELEGKCGNCRVSFYNGAAGLDFEVSMNLA